MVCGRKIESQQGDRPYDEPKQDKAKRVPCSLYGFMKNAPLTEETVLQRGLPAATVGLTEVYDDKFLPVLLAAYEIGGLHVPMQIPALVHTFQALQHLCDGQGGRTGYVLRSAQELVCARCALVI